MMRTFRLTALAAAAAWIAIVAGFGYFRFDDFWSIEHSQGAHLISTSAWHGVTADGRWQPLTSATFDLMSRIAGTTQAWPWFAAVAAAHLLCAWLTAGIARAIWKERETSRDAFALALASLNLSAFSLASIATLHGVLSTAAIAASAWAAIAAARTAGLWRAALIAGSALAALAACLYKESGVTAPALAVLCGVLMPATNAGRVRSLIRIALPPVAGVLAYAALRAIIGVPYAPASTRYVPSLGPHVLVNLAVVLVLAAIWLAPAAAGLIGGATRDARRGSGTVAAITLGWVVAASAPSLLLTWRSPGFWHLLVPGVALGAAAMIRHARASGRETVSYRALTAVTAAVFVVASAAFVRAGALDWGSLTRSALHDWTQLRAPGDVRVIWVDRDQLAPYGGLARLIGPGHRLRYALSMVSGESIDAAICAGLPVGPLYVPRPGDAVFAYSGGHLVRAAVPAERLYCLP